MVPARTFAWNLIETIFQNLQKIYKKPPPRFRNTASKSSKMGSKCRVRFGVCFTQNYGVHDIVKWGYSYYDALWKFKNVFPKFSWWGSFYKLTLTPNPWFICNFKISNYFIESNLEDLKKNLRNKKKNSGNLCRGPEFHNCHDHGAVHRSNRFQ